MNHLACLVYLRVRCFPTCFLTPAVKTSFTSPFGVNYSISRANEPAHKQSCWLLKVCSHLHNSGPVPDLACGPSLVNRGKWKALISGRIRHAAATTTVAAFMA